MTAFEVYTTYVALKLHFTSAKYDYFKFKGKVKHTEANFEKRKDRYFFKKIANKLSNDEVTQYFVANFVAGSHSWVGDMLRNDGEENYNEWKRRMESLHYTFSEDVDFLLSQVDNFEDLFKVRETHPPLIKFYLGKKICLETLCILNMILKFVDQFEQKIKEDLIWPGVKLKVDKYSQFLTIDLVKYKETLREKVLDHRCLSSIPT